MVKAKFGLTPDLLWLTLAMGLWGLGFGLYGVLWPLYIEHLHGGPVAVGLLSTLAGIATALVVFPGGWLADRVDRRMIIIWGFAIAVPVPFLFALAPTWQWLIPGVLLYFGSAFSTPAMQAVILSEAPPEHLSTAYNIVLGVFGAGMVIGSTIGGFLVSHYSYALLFVLSGSIYLFSTFCTFPLHRHVPQPVVKRKRSWTPKDRPRLFYWMIFAGGLAAVQSVAGPFIVPYWKSVGHLSVETIGFLGSVGILVGTLSAPLWGKMGEKIGIPRALGWGMGLVAIGSLFLIWDPGSVGWSLGAGVFRGAGESSRGLSGVAVGRTIPRDEAGTAYGLFNLITEAAAAIAPLPGGYLYHHWPYLPLVITTFFSGIIGWWLFSGQPGRPAPTPPETVT